MLFETKNFEGLIGIKGFSDQLLKNHFTLYQGYVTNTNKITETIRVLLKENRLGTPEFAELKRRLGWEFNGMRLHELYFENMTKGEEQLDRNSELFKKIVEAFETYENWEKVFKAVGSMRGIGWAVMYYDTMSGRIFNVWINEHDVGHLAGCKPLLVMDVFEHAYMIDYGLKRADYIEAFFKAIDWTVVSSRFKSAMK
jgi:Fe-Mn family superoxide dismutase